MAWLASAAFGADGIYWADMGSAAIRAGNLDGSGTARTLFAASSTPGGIAIDPVAGKIYWAGSGTINVGNLDGTGTPQALYTGQSPIGIAIDPAAGKIYWANFSGAGTIMVGNLDGTGTPQALYTSESFPAGVAVDPAAGKIYWADGSSNQIRVGNLNGSGSAQTLFASGVAPQGVAIDPAAGKIYWATHISSGAIQVGNLDGSGSATNLFTAENFPKGVAIDPMAGKVYWASNASSGAIRVGNLNGSGTPTNVFTGESSPVFPALLRAPSGVGMPAVAGGSTTGSSLSCSQGAWAADLVGSFLYRAPQAFAYQWSENGADVAGATSSSYTPSAPGNYTCRVTASNLAGLSAQTSVPHAVVSPPPICQPVSAVATAGQPVIVALNCSDPSGATVTYALDGLAAHGTLSAFNASTGEVTYTPAVSYSGADSFTYHASSANGSASVQTVSITVKPKAPPTITSARLTNRRFRVAARPTAISARKAPLGTSFRFTLSTRARLQIRITHSAPGLRSGHRCLAPSRKLKRVHAKRCNRTVIAGTLTRASVAQGPDSVLFTGRIGHRPLTPGVYHAILQARNADGVSRPATLTLTIVR
jgi:hypothetical protein